MLPHRDLADTPTLNTTPPVQAKVHMPYAILPFAWGVSLAVLGIGLADAVNFLTGQYLNSKTKTWAHPWSEPGEKTWIWGVSRDLTHVVAALAGVASVVVFVCGIFAVRNSVEHIPPASHTQVPSMKPSP